jgi:hypothetical protein
MSWSKETMAALEWAEKDARKVAACTRALIGLEGVTGDLEGWAQRLEGFAVELYNLQKRQVVLGGETYEVRAISPDSRVVITRKGVSEGGSL